MLIDKPVTNLFLFTLVCLVLSGCGTSGSQFTPTAELIGGEPDQIQLICPKEDTLFSPWFSHFTVLEFEAGDRENFHLEEESFPQIY